MNPITHLLAGWATANIGGLDRRGRTAVTVAGVIPDIDGLGLFAEKLTEDSSDPLLWWSDYHHVLAHNIGFGLLVAAVCYAVSAKKSTAALLGFVSFHLHILMDLIGAGGPGGEHWPMTYLLPFYGGLELEWSGQWPINAWQNVVVTAVLIGVMFYMARERGYSVLGLFSGRADRALVEALRRRFPVADKSS